MMRTTLTTYRRPAAVLAAGAALTLILTACGNSDDPPAAGASSTSPSAATASGTVEGVAVAHNDADVTFINDMAPHHSGALEMAELAAGQAGSPQVKDLAARIAAAQEPEIMMMQDMAAAWGVSLNTDASAMGGMDHSGGAMAGGDTEALMPLSGGAFDREFLSRMTAHHASAVEMAQAEIAQGENPQAKQLATEIVAAQQAEIAEMADLLAAV